MGLSTDREKVIKRLKRISEWLFQQYRVVYDGDAPNYYDAYKTVDDAIALLKEQEPKRIALHKKHVITWSRNEEFSMRKLYEAICETLLDEDELFIERTDNHEKVDFVFYVAEGR